MTLNFSSLRLVASLRGIAKALERANELELNRQQMEYPPIKDAPTSPKKMVISRPTVGDWNDREV